MKKKGSLSLSINAIVILVLAITMLGLGLAFTKGMFGELSSKLSVPEPDIPATADDTIVTPSEELEITKNKQFVFSVNAYNDDFVSPVLGRLSCLEETNVPEGKTPAGAFASCSGPQDIPPAEDKGFKFIIPKGDVSIGATRVCRIEFYDSGESDVVPDDAACAGPSAFPGSNVESEQIVVTIR